MTPGRTSNTGTPSAASLTAKSEDAIASPALLTQYSPRFGDTIVAETEVTNTIATGSSGAVAPSLHEQGRDALGQEIRALQVRAQHFLEARFGRFEQIRRGRAARGRRC